MKKPQASFSMPRISNPSVVTSGDGLSDMSGVRWAKGSNGKLKKIYVHCKASLTYSEAIEMINVAITKLSSKGQIVIPSEMRDDFSKGEKLVIIKSGKQLILKKVSDLGKNFEEDLAFAKKTEDAWQSYERGEFVSLPADKFLEELEKC